MCEEKTIGGKHCYLFEESDASVSLIQPIDAHDLEFLNRQIQQIRDLAPDHPFTLTAFVIEDWNRELSPWEAPPVFGKEGFGDGAKATLAYINNMLIPELEKSRPKTQKNLYYLGGYSLSGLFSLWSSYQTERFHGIAAISPSVWFPGWDSFIRDHNCLSEKVYLSLGDREEKTKNRTMAKVGENLRLQHELLSREITCALEWNPGNHFVDSDLRTAKGFAWLLNKA